MRAARRALAVLACATMFWAGAALAQAPDRAPPPLEQIFGGPLDLVDHDGRPRSDRDFSGKYLLIYFGYTHCPDICPLNLEYMAEAMGRLGAAAARVQPLFISIDPKRDTPALLKDYVGAFDKRFIALTGGEAQVTAAARAYRVHRRKVADPSPRAEPGDYLVDHASITYLVGPDGKFVTLFPHNTDGKRMAEVIAKYLE